MITTTLPLIIIGTGLAGYSLAKEFRKLDSERKLILITQDDGHFYSKPQLSTALEQNKVTQDLVVTDVEKMQTQLAAQILTYSHVDHIDIDSQAIQVQTPTGIQMLPFGQCVFALGASPKPFSTLAQSPHHIRVNNLQEYGNFRALLEKCNELTLIGSGLVGCEFAHDLSKQALPITLVTPDPYPLFGLVPAQIGNGLQQALQNKGIKFHTQTQIQQAQIFSDHTRLDLSSGETISTKLILSAIGLAPNISLAQKANIRVEKGIVVNDYLQTSANHIFALGDCAQISGVCRQYVAPILHCARALAQTLCGNLTAVSLPPMPIALKVSSYPVIVFPPASGIQGEWHIEQINQDYQCLFYDDAEILQGYALSGKWVSERQNCLQRLGKALDCVT